MKRGLFAISILIFLIGQSCSNKSTQLQSSEQAALVPLTKKEVIDTIWNLKEVQIINNYVKRKTDGKGKLYVTFYPELYGVEDKFYHVKVREQISSSQVGVYFHFYVYPETHEILHFTPRTGQAITLSEFREMLQERANKGKKE